jgi:hypothetical protein
MGEISIEEFRGAVSRTFLLEYDDSKRQEYFDETLADQRAELLVRVFRSERTYARKLRQVEDLAVAKQIIVGASGTKAAIEIDPTTYHEMASVWLVSALENFLRDAFLAFDALWFKHLVGRHQRISAVSIVSKRLRLDRNTEETLRKAAKSGLEELQAAMKAHFSPGQPSFRAVSFQRLDGKASVDWLYKQFFGFDPATLNGRYSDRRHWNLIRDLFLRRHSLIHESLHAKTSRDLVNQDSKRVQAFQKSILRELMDRLEVDRSAPI